MKGRRLDKGNCPHLLAEESSPAGGMTIVLSGIMGGMSLGRCFGVKRMGIASQWAIVVVNGDHQAERVLTGRDNYVTAHARTAPKDRYEFSGSDAVARSTPANPDERDMP